MNFSVAAVARAAPTLLVAARPLLPRQVGVVRLWTEAFALTYTAELRTELAKYPGAEIVWTQEEPANQGAWPFMALHLPEHLDGRALLRASRPEAAATAVGSLRVHEQEQRQVVTTAFA